MSYVRHYILYHVLQLVIISVQKTFKNVILLLLLMEMKGDRVWHSKKGIEDFLREVTQ